MDHYTLVRPEHLNHYGYLFGGVMLKWIDEFAWLTASRDFPKCMLVTIAMNNIQFRQRVINGSILRFHVERLKQGKTSVCYTVKVYAEESQTEKEKMVFRTQVTFVRVNDRGEKMTLPENAAKVIPQD